MVVPKCGLWPTKWSLMLVMSSISIRTKINRLDSKKRPFLSLSRDIDEKDIFGGQFVSFYF